MKNKQTHITWRLMLAYRQGKLSADEMHEIEIHLHQCGLCQEAMEGMEKSNPDQANRDMLDLKTQLQNRLADEKKSSILLFPYWKWAAAIAIIAVSFFALFESPFLKTEPATTDKTEHKPLSNDKWREKKVITKTDTTTNSSKPIHPETNVKDTEKKIATAKNNNQEPEIDKKLPEEKFSVDEPPIMAKSLEKMPFDTLEAVPNPIVEADKKGLTSSPEQIPNSTLKIPSDVLMPVKNKAANHSGEYLLTGKVVSVEDGEPLPGVKVTQKNSYNSTVTDVEGNFSLKLPSDDKELALSSIGYMTEEITIDGRDSLLIEMSPDIQALSEVVVVGYGQRNKNDYSNEFQPAKPLIGYKDFKKYIKDNLAYPKEALENQIEGTVVLRFSVSSKGNIQNIEVKKSIGYGCDKEAIRLLQNGPQWLPAEKDGQTVEQTKEVRIRFKLP